MRRLIEIVSSDLSGEEGAETVEVPGFKLDLTAAEKADLFKKLEPYLNNTNAKKTEATTPRVQASNAKLMRDERNQAREWLNRHGYVVGAKGRISADLWRAFKTKTPAPGWIDPAVAARREDSAAYHEALASRVKTVKPSKKTQAQMSPAFKAAEEAAGIGVTRPTAVEDTELAKAVNTAVRAPRKTTSSPRKAAQAVAETLNGAAPKVGANVVPMQPQKASKAGAARGTSRAAAATKAAPRKTTATAKVSRTT